MITATDPSSSYENVHAWVTFHMKYLCMTHGKRVIKGTLTRLHMMIVRPTFVILRRAVRVAVCYKSLKPQRSDIIDRQVYVAAQPVFALTFSRQLKSFRVTFLRMHDKCKIINVLRNAKNHCQGLCRTAVTWFTLDTKNCWKLVCLVLICDK